MFALIDVIRAHRRGTREQKSLAAVIQSWGGEVLESRRISRLVKSPFRGYRVYPNLHEFRSRHGVREGVWYVRTSSDEHPSEWAWSDQHGYTTLPVEIPGARVVIEDPRAIGWFEDSFLVGGMIVMGVSTVIGMVLLFT